MPFHKGIGHTTPLSREFRKYFHTPWPIILGISFVFAAEWTMQEAFGYMQYFAPMRAANTIHLILSPLPWLTGWLAWRSVITEHQKRRAHEYYLSSLTSKEIFLQKYLPLALFLFVITSIGSIIYGFYYLYYVSMYYHPFMEYIIDLVLSQTAIKITINCLILSFVVPLFVYVSMLNFRKSASTIQCIIVPVLVYNLMKALLLWFFIVGVLSGVHIYFRLLPLPPYNLIMIYDDLINLMICSLLSLAIAKYVKGRFKQLFREGHFEA